MSNCTKSYETMEHWDVRKAGGTRRDAYVIDDKKFVPAVYVIKCPRCGRTVNMRKAAGSVTKWQFPRHAAA